MVNRNIAAIVAVALMLSLASVAVASSATVISATDSSGDVATVSLGSPIPSEVVSAVDLVSVEITFADSSTTATFQMAGQIPSNYSIGNYSIFVYADIMGTYGGQKAHLLIGAGNPPGLASVGYAFAIVEDEEGNGLAFYFGDSVSVQVSGSTVTITAPIGTSSFTPSLGSSGEPSTVYSGAFISGSMSGGANDEINLYESGSITGGEVTTSPTQTTTTTETTTTTPPGEETTNPMDESPTTADVAVSIGAPAVAHITFDTLRNLASIDLEGEGSTSGSAPDHVGIAIIAVLKDGNVSYTWINGDMNWDPDNDPSNGYAFTMQYMSYSINLKVTPTGPADNPWATFSYSFMGTVPADYLGINYGLSHVDRFYILARAYLDRDEETWNQAYAEFTPTSGTGEVATPPTQTTTTTETTTTTQESTGGAETTSSTNETLPGGGGGTGLNPLLIGGVLAAVIIVAAVAVIIKRR